MVWDVVDTSGLDNDATVKTFVVVDGTVCVWVVVFVPKAFVMVLEDDDVVDVVLVVVFEVVDVSLAIEHS